MRLRSTLILLCVLALVGGAILLLTRDGTPADRDGGVRFVIPQDQLDWSRLKTIELQTDDTLFRFEREGPDWWQTTPARFQLQRTAPPAAALPGQSVTVFTDLIGAMQASTVVAETGDDVDQALLGFDEDTPQLKLVDQSGNEQSLRIGTVRLGAGYVASTTNGTVWQTSDAFRALVEQRPFHGLRNPNLTPAPIHRASAIRITRPDGTHALQKQGGLWRLHTEGTAGPVGRGLCDRSLIEQAVQAISQAQVLAYVDDAPQSLRDAGLGEGLGPSATVVFATPVDTGQGATTQPCTLRLGRPANAQATAYLATWSVLGEESRAVIALSAEAVGPWLAPVDVFRLARPLPDAVSDLAWVQHAEQRWSQTADGWVDQDQQLMTEAGHQALTRLLISQGIELRFNHPVPSNATTLTFQSLTRSEPVSLFLWQDQETVWFQRQGESVAFQLSEQDASLILPIILHGFGA